MKDSKWCDKCGNPGPFNDKTCMACLEVVGEFITDQKEAYKVWLDYQRITGKLADVLTELGTSDRPKI